MKDTNGRIVYPVRFCGCDGSKSCSHSVYATNPVYLQHDPGQCGQCAAQKRALEGFGRG